MDAVGVIVEYNPFHNGHAYHLQQARKVSDAEVVIAVMSGNFLQRGEPALISKWKRTEMALQAGVDIVFELPYQFATQHAEVFANGAVSILASAGCRSLCFGSEAGDIESFKHTLSLIEQRNDYYQSRIKLYIEKGFSYPKASSLAYHDLAPDKSMIDLSKPNNILGYQYLKAASKHHSELEILTVTRKNADYHDENFSSESIASATSIRKEILSENGKMDHIYRYVPESTYKGLLDYKNDYGLFHYWELYWPFLKYRLIQCSPDQLRNIYEIEEGLENRMISAALQASSFQSFMNQLKTRRYTWTRLQRACVHILTNTLKSEMDMKKNQASYLRLLGMTVKGREYLNKHKSDFNLPVISRISSQANRQLKLDIRASRVYAFGAAGKQQQKLMEQEFRQPPILI